MNLRFLLTGKLSAKRAEKICQILEGCRRKGDGAGYLLGEHHGFMPPIFGVGSARISHLSKKTGISTGELREFRRTVSAEMKERIRKA
ncbi:MAG: hypothetical protein Q8Q90_02635 [bacterium]|nr:hypothetical protein [bacterium]